MMRKFALIILFIGFTVIVFGQTNFWVGNSTNWHDPNNWSLNHVPVGSEDVTIPAVGVTYFPNIYAGNADCNNFTIVSEANVELYNGVDFNINGDANISGDFSFWDDGSTVNFYQDVNWWSGSQCYTNYTSDLNIMLRIFGNWTFGSGANVVMDKQVCMFFSTSPQIIWSNSASSSFGLLSVVYDVTISGSSTEDLIIEDLYISSSGQMTSDSNHDIIIQDGFTKDGSIYCNNGSMVFNNFSDNVFLLPGDYFNDLTINNTSFSHGFYNSVDVRGDLTINDEGLFFPHQLLLGGGYDNNSGETINVNEIIIQGNGNQNIYHLDCQSMILNKPEGEMRFLSETSTCNNYEWEQGFLRVAGGTFIINDLVDDAIYGTISITSGQLDIYQDEIGWVDLNCTYFMTGGVCNIYGGADDSYWTWGGDVSFTMSGGVLNFIDNGVRVYNSSYNFTENITGGTIKTAYNFRCFRSNFNPTGGTIEMYGTDDAICFQEPGSNFFNFMINKSSEDGKRSQLHKNHRINDRIKSTKSNAVEATSNLDINGDFVITEGSFTAPAIMNIAGDWNNMVGSDGFIEGTNLVVFDGDTDQNCWSEHFDSIEVDKSGGYLTIQPGVVYCNAYDWTQGGFHILEGGACNLFDLVDDGIYGNNMVSGGALLIQQGNSAGEYVDINGDFTILGGLVVINGGADDSYWTYNGDVNFTMSGGILTFNDVGVRIYDHMGYSFTENITGGSIRTNGNFIVERIGYTPAGGYTVMLGSEDCDIAHVPESNIYHLLIDKTDKGLTGSEFGNHPRGKVAKNGSRTNMVTAQTNLDIEGDFIIYSGSFTAPEIMNIGGNWENQVGESAFIEDISTVNFVGDLTSNIDNDETFFNLTQDKNTIADSLYFSGNINVLGNLTINTGEIICSQGISLNVYGDANLNSGGVLWVEDNCTLALGAGSQFNLFNNAAVYFDGLEGNEILVTHISSGMYGFSNLGTIGAKHTIFEYMDQNGINTMMGGYIHPYYSFDNCLFRNGASAPSTMLTINNDQEITCTNTAFENTSGSTQYNVTKEFNEGEITFTNFSGDFSGEAFDDDVFNRIHWDEGIKEVELSLLLEGCYSGGNMLTDLQNLGLIPLDQPFNTAPWNYGGSESVINVPTDVVDWVLIEYRDAPDAASANSTTTIGMQATFLLSDGNVVDIDGVSLLNFPYTISNQLFLVVHHRNHLPVMSSAEVTESGGIYFWSFNSPSQAYGTDALKDLGGDVFGLYAGDANADGIINHSDRTAVWETIAGTSGYLGADFNLDGQVDNKDKNNLWYFNYNEESQIP